MSEQNIALKVQHLLSCIDAEAWEDVAAHLCDLLEHCRGKIITHDGMMFANLEAMVKKYGAH